MTIYLSDLVKNPGLLKELREKALKDQPPKPEKPSEFEELGQIIEEHPIPSAGIRRGSQG